MVDTSQLKSYAPVARREFIAAVTAQAARLGVTADDIAAAEIQGDVLLVNGQAFPRSVQAGRNNIVSRVKSQGFDAVMDAVAYTWFNRFVAIRYMELHDYLDHGYRVLSNSDGSGRPEILDKATDIELPGLDRAMVVELKLDGTKDDELYRLLLKAQCNALHRAMPFLFERIGDETELLLPANLLHTDSLITKLVESIDEEHWAEIEIIGWLYQFYISEKKKEVDKVVKSEDIPAATQLFTPNWIVKYLVQNSLGAQWLATYPQSPLRGMMEYYIEPAEQADEVKAQLAEITPESLNPEEITLIDPACGSGHILVEAYDLFKTIYLERGYRAREAARLILTKNLFGLDIDQRAAQLSGFALMMKGRGDDRRLFERNDVKLNVIAMVNSDQLDIDYLAHPIKNNRMGLEESDLRELKKLFEHATTFGSLIQIPEQLAKKLPALSELCAPEEGYLYVEHALESLEPLIRQAEILAKRFDCFVANPPYLGSKGMNGFVKKFVKEVYPDAKSDLFACFIERSYMLTKPPGLVAQVTMQNWMFLPSFLALRESMLKGKSIQTLVQIGYNSFPSMNSKIAQAAVFTVRNQRIPSYIGSFVNLNRAPQSADKEQVFLARNKSNCHEVRTTTFHEVPGSPIAYWISDKLRSKFTEGKALESIAPVRQGFQTGDNDRFLRYWYEVKRSSIGIAFSSTEMFQEAEKKFAPYNKGGDFRKWFGNNEYVVAFDKVSYALLSQMGNKLPSRQLYFKESVTWSSLSSGSFGARANGVGFTFSAKGACAFPKDRKVSCLVLGLLNSCITSKVLEIFSPTLDFNVGAIRQIPLTAHREECTSLIIENSRANISTAKKDWDAYERSWDFASHPLSTCTQGGMLEATYFSWLEENRGTTAEMKRLEEENNRLFIEIYGLQDELSPEVPIEQITLSVNPAYRYGVKGTEEARETRFREDTMHELISYAIGCMMGRYSLDEPGLVYASSGNQGFDPSRYSKFHADEDGIIPLTDAAWFEDDAVNRLVDFASVAWASGHLEENLSFLASGLSPSKNETSRETIRRYLCDKFFKEHISKVRYNKRPIYWLFTSGDEKAFQCLVYLHRYNEGTLARMRNEYVLPLQSKMAARLDHLAADIEAADFSTQQKRLQREADKLKKQQSELLAFDEKLRHYADRRITLELDDGVKVNYGKFGSLLAEAEKIHGKKPEGP